MIEKEISHRGTVKEILEDRLVIDITSDSACMSCCERKACHLAEMKVKEIVISDYEGTLHEGQEVNVLINTSHGFKAVFFCYLFPLLFVLITMFVSSRLTGNDAITGIFSLLVLVPYYLILYRFRERLKRSVEFKIEPVIT